MDAEKFLTLYEKALSNAIAGPVLNVGEYAVFLADMKCIGRMRMSLAMVASTTGNATADDGKDK